MRSVTVQMAGEMKRAMRCHPHRRGFERCVLPALRHAVMASHTAAFVLRTVIAPVPRGRCRGRLLDLPAANAAANEQAQWALTGLYDRARGQRAAVQVALIAAMLTRAANATGTGCSPADGPAS
jgi:hypothetical protein